MPTKPRVAGEPARRSKASNLARLKRIEGQIRGIAKMIEDDRYCIDVLQQITAVQQAMRGVSKELVKGHLAHCVPAALKRGETKKIIAELSELFGGMGR